MTAQAYAHDPLLRDSRHHQAAAARELAEWLQYLTLANTAARTLDTYERVNARLLRNFPHKTFGEFNDGDCAYTLAQYPAKSRSTNKAAMNGWFKWGVKTRRIAHNPVDLLPSIRYKPDRAHDLFTDAERDALCALPSPDGHLLTLMFWAGLRRSECIGLTGKRLDLDHRQVVVIDGAKGGKSRRVPMIARVATAAAELLTLEGIGPDDYLWYTAPSGRTRRHTKISSSRFDLWWQEAEGKAGVRHRRAHLARHTFATNMRRAGLAMEEIQHLLGHESIRTTSDIYVLSNLDAIGDHMREAVGDLA